MNLIDNALKHSPKGDTVTVGLEVQSPKSKVQSPKSEGGSQTPEPTSTSHVSRFTFHASRLLLWVEDHGEGIPPSEQEKIFERFYRRGSELRRQTQGVGIGLSIVKHIVEAHGGRVLVRSAVGQGSRFTIELPVAPAAAKSETRKAETRMKAEGRRPNSETSTAGRRALSGPWSATLDFRLWTLDFTPWNAS